MMPEPIGLADECRAFFEFTVNLHIQTGAFAGYCIVRENNKSLYAFVTQLID